MRGREVARLIFATAKARCSAGVDDSMGRRAEVKEGKEKKGS